MSLLRKCISLLLSAVICFLLLGVETSEAVLPRYADSAEALSETETAFIWPAPDSRRITSLFGNRKIALYGRERFHTGVDIHLASGDPILAMADGTVLVSVYDGGWGEYVIINHGDNLLSLYAHMNSRLVKRGDSVTAGQQIGTAGNTGLSEANHLHFELRENGKSINPFRYTYK